MVLSSNPTSQGDIYNLNRFVFAQERVYARALSELQNGQKRSHWMWFIFPQLIGLGKSARSVKYALSGLDETRAYYHHPLLGKRLLECSKTVNQLEGVSIPEVFGYPDTHKFRSCMTLFRALEEGDPVFQENLDTFFEGKPDLRTLKILEKMNKN